MVCLGIYIVVYTTSSMIISTKKLREKFYEQNGNNIKHFITKLSLLKRHVNQKQIKIYVDKGKFLIQGKIQKNEGNKANLSHIWSYMRI